MYDLDVLICQGEEYLRRMNYSLSSINHYGLAWRRLRAWCEENSPEGYDLEVQNRYFADAGLGDPSGLSKHWRSVRTFVKALLSLEETGALPKRSAHVRYAVPEGFVHALAEYEEELGRRGLKASTIRGYLSTARSFFANCGEQSPDGLSVQSVAKFSRRIERLSAQTRSSKLYVVRDILGFLASRDECAAEVAGCMPLIPGHKHSTTPSAYKREEVESLLKGQFYESHLRPRRDRAIALLAGVLGMRVSDIKALRLSDVDWRAKKIAFVQRKTQVGQVLPMPDEVWLALADYLKNERPEVDSDRLFVTATAPYHAIDSSHAFHKGISRVFAEAGIDTAGRHHGMHSLRHSVASGMLAQGVPYPTISAVLGHSSSNVTKRYLSIDVESLRPIALEVPRCERR